MILFLKDKLSEDLDLTVKFCCARLMHTSICGNGMHA